jgi:MFS transporter, DHA2 family, multidrug resistance protein
LPVLGRELHVTASDSIWITNGYLLAVTSSLLLLASVGDARGAKRLYLSGLVLFMLASLGCGLSHNFDLLVTMRILQGFGTSAMIVTTQALNRSMFPPSELGRAISMNSIAVAVGASAGPTLGGFILAIAPWQWLFLVNVPLGLIAIVLGVRYLPRVGGTGGTVDITSAVLAATGFAGIIYVLDGVAHRLAPAASIVLGGLSLAAIALFVRRQLRLEHPLLAVELFRERVFTIAVVASTATYLAQGSALVALPFFFQSVLGRTPLESGLLLLGWPVAALLVAMRIGPLSDRYPATMLCTIGMAILGGGLVLFTLLPDQPTTAAIVLCTVVCGGGFATFQTPNIHAMLADVPVAKTARATGITSVARLTGQTAGAAVVATVFGILGASGSAEAGVPGRAAIEVTLRLACGFIVVAIALSCVRLRRPVALRVRPSPEE